jgi:AIG2-like family
MIYFAFGSNMDPRQMGERCPSHEVRGRACLPDFELCFPRRSPSRQCATAGFAPAEGAVVWGVLYELNDKDAASLHQAEGYVPGGSSEQNRHNLEEIQVRLDGLNGEAVAAFTYVAYPDELGAEPSREYMDHLISGAQHHGLPEAYLVRLVAIKTSVTVK